MTYLKAILMGLVQGVAEFLPISSSGHLAIARNLLNMEGAGAIPEFFDVLLHLGTLIAVFAAYWRDICDMVVEFFRGIGDLAHHSTPTPVPPARRLVLLIVIGTLPLFAVLPIRKAVQGLGDNMYFVGAALICTGILLFLCDRVRKGHKTERNARWTDALLVGEVWFRPQDHQLVRPVIVQRGKKPSEMKGPEDWWETVEILPGEPLMQAPDALARARPRASTQRSLGAPTLTNRSPFSSKTKLDRGWRLACRRLSGRSPITVRTVAAGSAASGSSVRMRFISDT